MSKVCIVLCPFTFSATAYMIFMTEELSGT